MNCSGAMFADQTLLYLTLVLNKADLNESHFIASYKPVGGN